MSPDKKTDLAEKKLDLIDSEFENIVIEARIDKKNKMVKVTDKKNQDQLRTKGYGENFKKEYLLYYYEALYLLFIKKLVIKNSKNLELSFTGLLKILLKWDKNIFSRFLIYRDLRSRGYVVKDGFGFGIDFRVYDRGEHNLRPAKYVVFGINEGIELSISSLSNNIKEIEKMGKEGIIAVIERRGEIIYYKINKACFRELEK